MSGLESMKTFGGSPPVIRLIRLTLTPELCGIARSVQVWPLASKPVLRIVERRDFGRRRPAVVDDELGRLGRPARCPA